MSYFRELPDLEYLSQSPDRKSSGDYIKVKNIFKRPKLREDIKNAITAFNYYQVEDGERPDQIAEKLYNDSSLDWVILITNNITNIKNDWPLDTQSFNNYVVDKYGSEENLYQPHHFETVETRDNFNRLVVPGGLIIDPLTSYEFASETTGDYVLPSFPAERALNIASVNLNQVLLVGTREGENIEVIVPEVSASASYFYVYRRENQEVKLTINNTYDEWPASWSGINIVNGRNEAYRIPIDDYIGPIEVEIPDTLYEVVGELRGGKIVPVFRFKQQ
jgi:hypothetical protein